MQRAYKIPLVVGDFHLVEILNVIDVLKEQGVEQVYVNSLQHIYK